ncbi:hypothetical protein [Imtechella halotolerans]|uniref:Brp/Blh family beta-carotene 15,15'-monooxygenase n=1 Tax=Imtechella halotolerans K1 TaxID=946077 RepID=I0WDP7_9FLAO|nr:hypothetical protein [Imtechella halotolerans]EID74513.1 hypothetical protein W5A_08282 [Imtechella halotolerans K1]WMQ62364.1 hypothetical protein PT603_08445 [Imtechella halotolerans]
MESKKYLEDISEIKNMMNRSTRFLSLSGLSGILAGVYALIGSYVAFTILQEIQYEQNSFRRILISFDAIDQLLLLAAIIALAAILTGILLSYRKAKRLNEKLWNQTAKRMLLNFSIPLVSGGIFCIALLIHDEFGLIAPATLLFYGFACINASKYTLGDIHNLGITCIILGLLSAFFIGYGLLFWALGFGVCHILYGAIMYFKYEKK